MIFLTLDWVECVEVWNKTATRTSSEKNRACVRRKKQHKTSGWVGCFSIRAKERRQNVTTQSAWREMRAKLRPLCDTVTQWTSYIILYEDWRTDCPASLFFCGNSSRNTNLASAAQNCVFSNCSDLGSTKTKSLCNNYSNLLTVWPP